jgi:hypothetical protein
MDKDTYSRIARHIWDEEEGRSAASPKEPDASFLESCEKMVAAHEELLELFSGDARLQYVCDAKAERFSIQPTELKVTVPVAFFQEAPFSEDRLLFHLYETLALYPDWRRDPELFLARPETFLPEAQELASCFLARVQELGLGSDAAYQPDIVLFHMQDEILSFLAGCDRWQAMLTVRLKAPRYREKAASAEIAEMLLWEDTFPSRLHPEALAPELMPSILQAEWFGKDSLEEPEIISVLDAPAMGKERLSFVRKELCRMLLDGDGADERDRFIRTFLMSAWMELFEEDIAREELSATVEEEAEGAQGRARKARRTPQMAQSDRSAMLKTLKDQKEARSEAAKRLIEGAADLASFGVTKENEELFSHYERKTRAARLRMRRFWQELIGKAAKEKSVPVTGMPTGKLDIQATIAAWPALVEAERAGSYRNLALFRSSELKRCADELPARLLVSFVVDNSGSMRSGKLEPAREALSVVLLSLEDFSRSLEALATQAHERIEVSSEVWLFGTHHRKVLSFEDTGRARRAHTVLSLSRLSGTDGSTDDGSCLEEVARSIGPAETRGIAQGRTVHLVFEVTDGASSFPGAARKAVADLEAKGAEIHAIEIGLAGDEEARTVFGYVFGERGTFLGERTDRLPEALLAEVRRGVAKAFLRSRRS